MRNAINRIRKLFIVADRTEAGRLLGRYRFRDSTPAYNQTQTCILPIAGALGQAIYSVLLDSTADNLTATPSGTQTTALALAARVNRVTTVATAGDAVRLPPALAGMTIKVKNSASANAMNVYPASAAQGGVAGGDAINALGANAAYSLAAGLSALTFTCFTTGTWIT
jgi:hypothetical protein